jgi:uncharacterized membrane protein YwzB
LAKAVLIKLAYGYVSTGPITLMVLRITIHCLFLVVALWSPMIRQNKEGAHKQARRHMILAGILSYYIASAFLLDCNIFQRS